MAAHVDRAAAQSSDKHLAPVPSQTAALMGARSTTLRSPILVRLYKKEAELEVWKQAGSGRFVLLKSFPICRWSGQLGPKRKQRDRQAPEGFYSVAATQMNPNSAYYLSFNIGYPNVYDRARGASGAHLMVHGTCSSAGCYAMTDEGIREIYAIAREAFAGGQKSFQFQAYPFRMTATNMARYRKDPNYDFWQQLKEGSDRFEATGEPPTVTVSAARYNFRPYNDAAKEALAAAQVSDEQARVAALVAEGAPAVRTTYLDGSQHPSFRRVASVGEVSRPEALASAPREVIVIPGRPRPRTCEGPTCATQTAGSKHDEESPRITAVKTRPVAPLTGQTPDLSPLTWMHSNFPLSAWSTIAGAVQILPVGFVQAHRKFAAGA
jgi:murein L,D-transpeptidase YafK